MNARPSAPSTVARSALPGVAGDGPLLPTVSIVEQAIAQARRSVALALAGSALLVCALLLEHGWYAAAQETAADRLARALQVAARVQLADQRLTASAQLAVTSGDHHWVDVHDAELPLLEDALTQARALATPAMARRFDEQTRSAQEELTNLREAAFAALDVAAGDAARAILVSDRYRASTARLTAATHELTAAMIQARHAEVEATSHRSLLTGAVVLSAALLLGVGLWRGLSGRLERSRHIFLKAEDRVQRMASSDLLTGMPNRAALHDAMASAMARARQAGHGLAVLMIDLDRFKPVNDRHGHMVGDLVLKEVAQRLTRCLRGGELQARYGGDEFVVAIEENGDPTAARRVAERIVHTLGQAMRIGDLSISIGASVGVARFPDDAHSGDELLRRADSALYRAKLRGRGGVCFYEVGLDEQVAEHAALEQALRDGIARGEFVPHYQPIVELATRQVQSLELLCRWQHPQRGLLAPSSFIGLAEATGLIGPLTLSLLRRACVDLARFPAQWRLSINVAPQQILDHALVPQLLAVLAEFGVPPARLDVELTETALVSDTARAREVMQALQQAGITVTLDDFGTGYSSLSYLAEMSFDKIKIDRSFVHTLHERAQSAKIVDAVIGLSRSLGVQTVAEGVETERDAAALLALGCGQAQGYLFGRPVPADEVPCPAAPTMAALA